MSQPATQRRSAGHTAAPRFDDLASSLAATSSLARLEAIPHVPKRAHVSFWHMSCSPDTSL